jgi:hypothetical protein
MFNQDEKQNYLSLFLLFALSAHVNLVPPCVKLRQFRENSPILMIYSFWKN